MSCWTSTGERYFIALLAMLFGILLKILSGSSESVVDEIAALYRDFKSLSEKLSEEEQPTIQVSAIAKKVASCCDRCYLALNNLGKERRAYERKIESLQNEIQALGRIHVTTGK